ncbi:MAG: hypothetical protein PHY82_05800 [Lentisphaeria bacterium]|jgi:hypothetical protein|nr:hypothetical protein [Lentisphaeria bacterium]
MVNNRHKNTANVILLVCALLFSSLEAIHSLVHVGCVKNTDSLKVLAKAKPAAFSRRQDTTLQTILILSPVCVEHFVAIADYIAFFDLTAEPVSVSYPKALVVFVTVFMSYSCRGPPYSSDLFAQLP